MNGSTKRQEAPKPTEQARRSVQQSERGDVASAERLRRQERANPEATEAAEQEVSDGPDKRGLSR